MSNEGACNPKPNPEYANARYELALIDDKGKIIPWGIWYGRSLRFNDINRAKAAFQLINQGDMPTAIALSILPFVFDNNPPQPPQQTP